MRQARRPPRSPCPSEGSVPVTATVPPLVVTTLMSLAPISRSRAARTFTLAMTGAGGPRPVDRRERGKPVHRDIRPQAGPPARHPGVPAAPVCQGARRAGGAPAGLVQGGCGDRRAGHRPGRRRVRGRCVVVRPDARGSEGNPDDRSASSPSAWCRWATRDGGTVPGRLRCPLSPGQIPARQVTVSSGLDEADHLRGGRGCRC